MKIHYTCKTHNKHACRMDYLWPEGLLILISRWPFFTVRTTRHTNWCTRLVMEKNIALHDTVFGIWTMKPRQLIWDSQGKKYYTKHTWYQLLIILQVFQIRTIMLLSHNSKESFHKSDLLTQYTWPVSPFRIKALSSWTFFSSVKRACFSQAFITGYWRWHSLCERQKTQGQKKNRLLQAFMENYVVRCRCNGECVQFSSQTLQCIWVYNQSINQ